MAKVKSIEEQVKAMIGMRGGSGRIVAILGERFRLTLKELFVNVGRACENGEEALDTAVAVAMILFDSEPSGFRPHKLPSQASVRTALYVHTDPEAYETVRELNEDEAVALGALIEEAQEWEAPDFD